MSGGRYVSGDQARRTFAARTDKPFTIEVDWRDGTRTALANAKAGRLYEIRQTGSQLIRPKNEVKQPFFADLSAQLGHEHKPSERNDFAIQPALPFRLGRSGPALATADIDGDGDRDLIITDTSDARLTFLLNDGNGVFAESPNSLPVGGTGVVVFLSLIHI